MKAPPQAPPGPAGGPKPTALSPGRRWLFRLAAAVLLPIFVLGAAELVLRLAGYGFSPEFFQPAVIKGERVLVENAQFGLRFFPPALARSPAPVVLPAAKPPGTYRIFLFGESAALGEPRPAYGMGRYLEALLKERYPKTRFEVACVAMAAINSHAVLPVARECARQAGDLWIVYMGNNEMAGPFGANTVFGRRAPPLGMVRLTLAVQTTRLGQALTQLSRRWRDSGKSPQTWGGLKMFMDSQLAAEDPRRQTVYANFRRNLDDILAAGRSAGVPVLLCTVASNLKDCPPFASVHQPGLSATQQAAWEASHGAGLLLEQQNRLAEAETNYLAAAQLDPQFAETHYRLGHCLLARTNTGAARARLEEARNRDALPFRADSTLNETIRMEAGRFAGQRVHLVDIVQALSDRSLLGIPGSEFFYDHVHLNLEGNYAVGRALAERISGLLPPTLANPAATNWAAAEVCERRLGLSDWNRYAVLESALEGLRDAPFTNQFSHFARVGALRARLTDLRPHLHPSGFMEARFLFEQAIKAEPRDFRLRENFAEFLETAADLEAAVTQWGQVCELLPHHYSGWFQRGRVLVRQQQYARAEADLREALRRRPDLAPAYLELGKAFAAQKRPNEALANYQTARRLRPEDPRVYVRLADALAALGQRAEAAQALRLAIRLESSYWEAHYLLGVELAMTDQIEEAMREFEAVVRLRPEFALAHLNLGIALARQRRFAEARVRFEETLQLDPGNKKAKEHLQLIESLTAKPAASPAP